MAVLQLQLHLLSQALLSGLLHISPRRHVPLHAICHCDRFGCVSKT